jgi:hypothetical protein
MGTSRVEVTTVCAQDQTSKAWNSARAQQQAECGGVLLSLTVHPLTMSWPVLVLAKDRLDLRGNPRHTRESVLYVCAQTAREQAHTKVRALSVDGLRRACVAYCWRHRQARLHGPATAHAKDHLTTNNRLVSPLHHPPSLPIYPKSAKALSLVVAVAVSSRTGRPACPGADRGPDAVQVGIR